MATSNAPDLPDLGKMIDTIKEKADGLQHELKKLQDDMAGLEVRGEAGGGLVVIVMTGRNDAVSAHVDPSLLTKESQQMLEELIVAAINDAIRKIEKGSREKMDSLRNLFALDPSMLEGQA